MASCQIAEPGWIGRIVQLGLQSVQDEAKDERRRVASYVPSVARQLRVSYPQQGLLAVETGQDGPCRGQDYIDSPRPCLPKGESPVQRTALYSAALSTRDEEERQFNVEMAREVVFSGADGPGV